jgi:hypothetical protein
MTWLPTTAMEFGYNAQYKQPFTLQEAAGLDVEVITEGASQLRA